MSFKKFAVPEPIYLNVQDRKLYSMKLSQFSKELNISPIREIADMLEVVRGDPSIISFGGGAPSFNPPEWLEKVIGSLSVESLSYKYTASGGMLNVRESIVKYLNEEKGLDVEMDNVIVQPCGATSGVFSAIFATVGPEDEAILLKPVYPAYPPLVEKFVHGKIRWVDTLPDTAFDIEKFKEQITKKTNVTVIISPDNPTGRVLTKDEMKAIGDLAVDHKFWIIHDEAYDEFVYSGKHHSFWELGYRENVIGIRGMSKFSSTPSLRLGFSYSPEDAREFMERLNGYSYLCPSSLSQLALMRYLEEKKGREEYLKNVRSTYMKRSRFMADAIKEHLPDAEFIEPQGAFYVFPNMGAYMHGMKDRDVFKQLFEKKKVVIVPGSAFGVDTDKGYFRMTFVSETEERIREGVKRIADYFSALKR